jgi:hypothetical protein
MVESWYLLPQWMQSSKISRGLLRCGPDIGLPQPSDVDPVTIITIWVDNLLLFAMLESLIEQTKANLEAEWELTDLGKLVKIVGIEIALHDHSVTISQWRYLESILYKEGMDNANTVGMPLDPKVVLEPNPDGDVGDQSNLYARLIGKLQFLANATGPDIMYAINQLLSYTANPMMQHITA